MKMPEGYDKWVDSYKINPNIPISIAIDKHDEAADLMKEMAEALEEVKKGLQVGDFSNKQLDLIYGASTKFKEWK